MQRAENRLSIRTLRSRGHQAVKNLDGQRLNRAWNPPKRLFFARASQIQLIESGNCKACSQADMRISQFLPPGESNPSPAAVDKWVQQLRGFERHNLR